MLAALALATTLALAPDGGQTPPQTPPQTPQERYERELQGDRELGSKYAAEYDKAYPPSKDDAAIARVKRVGESLALIANATPIKALWGDSRHANFQYTFKVVRSDDVNAFSLPGGYIYVFDGLVAFCESDDELAGVLAHEIGHAEQRHIATLRREQGKLQNLSLPLILAAIFTGGAALAPVVAGTQLVGTAITNGWSQKAETSADDAAYQYLGKSAYNPTGLLTFMERLRLQEFNQTKGQDLGIYRTHPPSAVRAERILADMKRDAFAPKRSAVTRTFRTTSQPMPDGTVRLAFGARPLVTLGGDDAPARAAKLVPQLNAFFDSVPEAYEVREGDGGDVLARNRPLLRLTPADAAAAGMPLSDLKESSVRNVRSALLGLAFHLWDGR